MMPPRPRPPAGHLTGELLKARSDARLNHVPFCGGEPAMNDLVTTHVPSLIDDDESAERLLNTSSSSEAPPQGCGTPDRLRPL